MYEKLQVETLRSLGSDGQVDLEKLKNNISENIPKATITGNKFPLTVTENETAIKVHEDGSIQYVTFYPEKLEIGTATNTDKYGDKVTKYTVQTEEMSTNVWRLFYQEEQLHG